MRKNLIYLILKLKGQLRQQNNPQMVPPSYNNPQFGLMQPIVNMSFPGINMNMSLANPQANFMGGNFPNIGPSGQFGLPPNQMGMYPSDQSQMMYLQGNQKMMYPPKNNQFQRQGQQGNMPYNNYKVNFSRIFI
jgi:hypothetical protein